MYKLFYMQVTWATREMGLKLQERQLRSFNWIQGLENETTRLSNLLTINDSNARRALDEYVPLL